MLSPAIETDIRFRSEQPPFKRYLGLSLALIGAAVGASVAFIPHLSRTDSVLLSALSVLLCGGGWWLALQVKWLDIDLTARSYHSAAGPAWRAARQSGSLDEFARIRIKRRADTNLYGESLNRADLELCGEMAILPICHDLPFFAAERIARRIADRTGLLADEVAAEVRQSRHAPAVKRLYMAAPFAGMACVFAVVMWPILTGKRPASSSSPYVRYSPPPPYGQYNMGLNLYARGDFKGAESSILDALKYRPNWPDAYNQLAYTQVELGRLDDALKTAQKALHQAPNDGNIMDTVAEMYQRQRNWAKAEEYYEYAIRHEGRFEAAETNVKFGQTLLALGKEAQARDQFERAIASHSVHWVRRAETILAAWDSGDRSQELFQPETAAQRNEGRTQE